jgi:Zn-dependent protease with chaperone function
MRRSYGRDFGLSLRMAVALIVAGLIYLAFEAFAAAMVVDGIRNDDLGLAASGLAFGGVIIGALVVQLRKSEQLILRSSDLRGGRAVQAFCIVGRRSKWRRFELFMDHPPVSKRVARLEELARELGKARG